MGVLYFGSLGAPDPFLARELSLSPDELATCRGRLVESLGLPTDDLTQIEGELSNGVWPRSEVPWKDRHAAHLIERGLDRPADDILLYAAGEGALTVGEVLGLVTQIRAGLRAEGVQKGSRVALDATQRLESFLLALALLLEGAEIIRLSDNLGPDTLQGMLEVAPALMTFTAHAAVAPTLTGVGKLVSLEPATAGRAFSDWVGQFDDQAEVALDAADIAPDDVALIGFTSGSTGTPKIVRNTHQAIWRSTEVAARAFGLSSSDVYMSATDFVALSGFRSMVSLPLFTGGRVVFPSSEARVTPLAQALEAEQYGVTCLTAVPNVLRGFVAASDRLTPGPHPTLRTVLSGSGVLDAPTALAFGDRFGATVIDYYGKREIGTPVYTEPDRATTMSTGGGRAAETLVRILDETGAPVTGTTPGEIVVLTDSGEARPDGDAATSSTPWHRTGDFGMLESGRIVITGRKSDIIKTPDGQLLAPIEVENILCRQDAITEAVVFPYRGPDAVERVGAAVLCAPTVAEEEFQALEENLRWAVHDALGAYKSPSHILVLRQFPRVGRDKPDRKILISKFCSTFVSPSSERSAYPDHQTSQDIDP